MFHTVRVCLSLVSFNVFFFLSFVFALSLLFSRPTPLQQCFFFVFIWKTLKIHLVKMFYLWRLVYSFLSSARLSPFSSCSNFYGRFPAVCFIGTNTHTCSMNTYQLTDQVSNVGQREIMFRQAEVEIVGWRSPHKLRHRLVRDEQHYTKKIKY